MCYITTLISLVDNPEQQKAQTGKLPNGRSDDGNSFFYYYYFWRGVGGGVGGEGGGGGANFALAYTNCVNYAV